MGRRGGGFRVVGEAVDEKTPQIAYADVLRVQDDWANAAGLAEEYGRLAEGALQADALTSRLAGSFHEDLEDGLTKTKAALLERPDSPAVIALIEREAAGRPPVEAQRLLFVALAYGAMPADQEKNLRVAYQKVSDKLEQERLFKEKERAEQAAREKADREKKRLPIKKLPTTSAVRRSARRFTRPSPPGAGPMPANFWRLIHP